ncbi:hypothetical protein [Okeania sp.]|uniref:hypothetical protein n=1 Tax=Okeania sp. TaxID=3100323 RepID=UPI002B4B8EB0|nr:hypothetical protein [Okeania sp.]MEB3339584.1 hypothetical protein [Okeania sp.]
MLTGNTNGYGYTALLIQIMVKLTTGFYQKLIRELFNRVLEDFAREFELGEDKQIILTIDRAGWHTSSELKIPLGLHLELIYKVNIKLASRLTIR